MDVHSDIHLTRGDIGLTTLAERTHVNEDHEPGETILNADLVADKLDFLSPNVHVSPVMHGIETHEGETLLHEPEKEPGDIQTEGSNAIDLDHDCTCPRSKLDQDILLASNPKEASPSECAVDPAVGFPPPTDSKDTEELTIPHSEKPPPSCARAMLTSPHDEGEVNTDDPSEIVHGEMDHAETVGVSHPADDEETREDFIDDPLPSLPPSSSPPQFFSSSPYASSQSSVNDIEHSKTVQTPAVESESCAISLGYTHDNHAVSDLNSHSDPEDLHGHETTEAETPSITNSHMEPSSCEEDAGLEHSRKRIADPDESHGSQLTKRPKSVPRFYLPPAPKRATLASQHHQFKKLAAPFRPPLRLPNAVEGPTATIVNNRKADSTISTALETKPDKIDLKGSTISLQHKALNTSRSATQFKSPLVNRIVPADARTVRLTPVLQALERKLQLLKRAVKVQEDNEEKVLVRLAEKWIEAGREVSYDIWDATKDTGDFTGKATIFHRSHGWESSDGKLWGWDTKTGDAGEESCNVDPSETSRATGQPTGEEEDDNIGCNTLGNMLRQLGIAPEIFGWDDDKEAFYD